MPFTETPKEKEKRLAYYAKNKADAKAKEDKTNAETLRKFNETTNTDVSKNTNPMGDTYKKGGKVMKKMKRYEDGGDVESTQGQNKSIGDDVRTRAMAAMEKGSSEESTSAPKKAAPKAAPKPAPKAESFTPSATKEDPAMVAKAYQDAAKMQAGKNSSAPVAAKEESKERNLPRGQAKASDRIASFIENSKAQIGQEAKNQEAKYKATQASMKESGATLSPRMKAARSSEKVAGMKAGGSCKAEAKKEVKAHEKRMHVMIY